MNQSNEDLEKVYGALAPYSEHKRGDHVAYTTAEGMCGSGTIIWVQAPFESIGVKYIVAPDAPTGFVDFVMPGDVINQVEQSDDLTQCPYCRGYHPRSQVEQCPLKPK